MANIPLGTVTSGARSGATITWTIPSGGNLAGSSGYTPGLKANWLKFRLIPGTTFTSIPPLYVSGLVSQTGLTANNVCKVGELRVGTSASPTGANSSSGTVIGAGFTDQLNTTGFNVSDFNAGNLYLWVGFDAYYAAQVGGVFTVSATGNDQRNGGALSPFSVAPTTGSNTHTFAWSGVTTQAKSSGIWTVTPSGFTTPTVEYDLGGYLVAGTVGIGSWTGSINGTPYSSPTTNTVFQSQSITGVGSNGVGIPITLSLEGTTVGSLGAGSIDLYTLGGANYAPSTLALSSISVFFYPARTAGAFRGSFGGSLSGGLDGGYDPSLGDDMSYNLDDIYPIFMQCSDPSTGAATDATGTPTYRVYEETTGSSILTGNLSLIDSSNTNGTYSASITLSAGSGFEVGKTYTIIGLATVAGVAQQGILGRFAVEDATPSEVWDYPEPGDSAGRATTMGGMLRQIWSYCVNRNSIQSSIQTIYMDDSSTPMLSGSQSATDTMANRGRMD